MITKKTKGLFNHNHIFKGYGSDITYLYNKGLEVIDGIGTRHVSLYAGCDICGEEILVAKIHVSESGVIYNPNKEDE